MPKLEYWQKEQSNYWSNYANILFLNKNYATGSTSQKAENRPGGEYIEGISKGKDRDDNKNL